MSKNSLTSRISDATSYIQRLDQIYQSSPTAQLLVSNAPQILQSFNSLKALAMQQDAQLKALAINRDKDLEQFREVASGMMNNLHMILSQIHNLQNSVRECVASAGNDPNARTVIEFTNRQIDQNIAMFNNLTFQLLNA
ncbi:MAG: hypothetical protein K2H60_00450 [Muribaculaceae bacterium]|nr:hypothetical protein [Muribaculaceae bacterium]